MPTRTPRAARSKSGENRAFPALWEEGRGKSFFRLQRNRRFHTASTQLGPSQGGGVGGLSRPEPEVSNVGKGARALVAPEAHLRRPQGRVGQGRGAHAGRPSRLNGRLSGYIAGYKERCQ
jgi:hypothetical protein